ncbi:MAG: hypothetical protein Q7S58_17840, partial [Candidatus Binatus sp.]|uniref:hypothetical protein n=1 Tax=Candidatus Binatus sp. TaxID=2811406 RepID=UPI002719EDD5
RYPPIWQALSCADYYRSDRSGESPAPPPDPIRFLSLASIFIRAAWQERAFFFLILLLTARSAHL